ncbi:MBL fold metallo-hydrolase [Stutzerimonas zhaodongensis]|uniref:Ribonuclease Z n=1 Tax=Stutzerimonas zhaodongensis TaxID=1176257 RepID=A0A3M2HS59_9GAMM|nr:ribonuclease Z [Stutzerimonas zhaodongensis]MCQ4316855.1 ribonuclease Z [Stutzerimonas zhaodongensis]RMH92596.1 MBL fold metallo-hydrolase [Stutzerimonas zhaodongensis]
MDLLFLGTSSGTPTRTRNVSGLALLEDTGKGWYLIDCGEATQHQILRTPLTLHGLRAIFITHVHGDHCYGLPGLLASAGMARRLEPLEIVAPAAIESWVRATLQMSQSHLPYELVFHATESLNNWRNQQVSVKATTLSHRVPSWGYSFTETRPDPRLNTEKLDLEAIPRGPLWGELMRGNDAIFEGRSLRSEDYLLFTRSPRRIVIAGDNDDPELLRNACTNAQVLVHEATYTQPIAEAGKADFGHSTAAQVATFAEDVGIANLILTHFSARYQPVSGRALSIDDIRAEATARYNGKLFLAEDFMQLTLDKRAELLLRTEAER